MAVYEDQIKQLDAKLDAYDAILAKQKYLAGDVRIILPDFEAIAESFNRSSHLLISSTILMALCLRIAHRATS
jgi:hypothetical protein